MIRKLREPDLTQGFGRSGVSKDKERVMNRVSHGTDTNTLSQEFPLLVLVDKRMIEEKWWVPTSEEQPVFGVEDKHRPRIMIRITDHSTDCVSSTSH